LLPGAYSAQSERRFQGIVNSPVVSAASAADVGNLFTMISAESALMGWCAQILCPPPFVISASSFPSMPYCPNNQTTIFDALRG
jgi:hypothetical protein